MSYTFDANLFSDLHKDAYGFRPRGHRFYDPSTTDDERQQIWDYVCADLDAEIEREQREHMAAIQHLEANVQRNMDLGAPDRETAIRWVIQSLDLDEIDMQYGGSRVCYELGLPFDMAPTFDPIMKEMR